jgi:tetratricopeptide (TPR) repeat protein
MNMKSALILAFALAAAGCTSNTATAVNSSNNSAQPMRADKLQSTTVHTTEGTDKPASLAADADAAKGGKWSASGDPIDTKEFDKTIADAEKAYKANASDAGAKEALANAYFKRATALTEARQYASALGDYRRVLKLDPNHEEAKSWEQQIIGIYTMMKKEYPKPGEEPAPLPMG